jgi:2,5-diketo-D-gluconate reductase B
MIYRHVQGVDVPALGLGTWLLRGAACREAIRDALEIGYRHVDTAQAYENEGAVGQGWTDAGFARDEVFITTKLQMNTTARKSVRDSVERSLEALRSEYVDLLLIHWPPTRGDVDEALDAMAALREEGKARLIGVSNFPSRLWLHAIDRAPVSINQVEYHPYLGQTRLLEVAREHDQLLTAYSPIAKGSVLRDPVLREIGEEHGKSPVQVALRWLLQQDRVLAVPKAASAAHRRANLDLFDFELTQHELNRISALDEGRRLIDPAWGPDWD